MLKSLLRSQRLISKIKKFKTEDIFDIVVYGSAVRGKERINDIDIAIILNEKTGVNEKLKLAEKLKTELDSLEMNIDAKAVDISDLEDEGFIARQAILAEGYSLIYEKFLHERFGFNAFAIFSYSLKGISSSKKKMLYYALKGRRGQEGLLKLKDAEMLGNCVIKVPIAHSEEFMELLKGRGVMCRAHKVVEY